MNKREVGTKYETLACEFLVKNGYKIIERNFRNRIGEIDIIAKDNDYICFIEVKERSTFKCGVGLEAVNYRKQQIIIKVARYYLFTHKISENNNIRFDVISIDNNKMTLIKNAFIER